MAPSLLTFIYSLLQALYNVSSTSTRSADEVLDEIKRVLELADIMFKQKGFVGQQYLPFTPSRKSSLKFEPLRSNAQSWLKMLDP